VREHFDLRPLRPDPDADYKVADITLADWGRKEIAIAETEMPGLMALREKYGADQAAEGRAHHRLAAHDHPDRGADRDPGRTRRRGALVLLQHLLDPGPRRRRHRRRGIPVYAWKGETLEEYWWCTEQVLNWPTAAART
jgi:adenosylhomocysteinase